MPQYPQGGQPAGLSKRVYDAEIASGIRMAVREAQAAVDRGMPREVAVRQAIERTDLASTVAAGRQDAAAEDAARRVWHEAAHGALTALLGMAPTLLKSAGEEHYVLHDVEPVTPAEGVIVALAGLAAERDHYGSDRWPSWRDLWEAEPEIGDLHQADGMLRRGFGLRGGPALSETGIQAAQYVLSDAIVARSVRAVYELFKHYEAGSLDGPQIAAAVERTCSGAGGLARQGTRVRILCNVAVRGAYELGKKKRKVK